MKGKYSTVEKEAVKKGMKEHIPSSMVLQYVCFEADGLDPLLVNGRTWML